MKYDSMTASLVLMGLMDLEKRAGMSFLPRRISIVLAWSNATSGFHLS